MENRKSPNGSDAELPQDRVLERGSARLRSAVTELPLRYAPFFERLGRLWNLPEQEVERQLGRARSASAWRRTILPGLSIFNVAGSEAGRRARLMRFRPGARFPRHTHRGPEQVLVLEGAYRDVDGRVFEAGDVQTMSPGSEHELEIVGTVPCVAAVSETGIDFVWPWRRWAARLRRYLSAGGEASRSDY